jgi:tetratricopeptide (TPR) repeat protein
MPTLKKGLISGLFLLSIVLSGCSKSDDAAATHRALGNDAARKGDWATAATEYGLAAQANPKDRKIWELKANAHIRLDQLQEAAESLKKSAEYVSEPAAKAEIYRQIAGMYVDQKQFDQAENTFSEALKINPTDQDSLSWLGELASARGGARSMTDRPDPVQLMKAVGYYDKVIALNPENLFAYVNKRIALTKYVLVEEEEKAQAQKLVVLERKDPEKVAAAQTRVTQATARLEGYNKEIESLSKKIKELVAAQKAKKQSGG